MIKWERQSHGWQCTVRNDSLDMEVKLATLFKGAMRTTSEAIAGFEKDAHLITEDTNIIVEGPWRIIKINPITESTFWKGF